MKKAFFILIVMVLASMAAYCEIMIPEGSLIQVFAKKPISTSSNQEGDPVYFLNPSDIFSKEEKVFPKNTIFAGRITFLKLPIRGVNGALRADITQAMLPNGTSHKVNGSIYYNGSTTIGGGLTPPASYNKSVHRMKGWTFTTGVLQLVPSGEYEFGQHTTITTREPVFIQLNENYIPK